MDHRGTEGARADSAKIKALRDYHHARGLCFKCSEHWGHDHVCPMSVQLHVIKELLELFGLDTIFHNTAAPIAEAPEMVMAISRQAISGGVSSKAFQQRAWIQGHEVLMMVDSGSSTSFVNQDLAQQLTGVRALSCECRVRVADGGELRCSSEIPACQWCTQGSEFTTDLKILALGTYDTILGMNWLEQYSPMTVDWCHKGIDIPTPTGTVCLRGHEATSSTCLVINTLQLQNLRKEGAISHVVYLTAAQIAEAATCDVPVCVQEVVEEFSELFGEPVDLPPRRECDHRIPLIPGAQLVNIRPY